jgi:hypothetical protein
MVGSSPTMTTDGALPHAGTHHDRFTAASSDDRLIAQFPALSIRRVVKTFSSQPISISGTDFSSKSV